MQTNRIRRVKHAAVGGAVGAILLFGGTAAAGNYPPGPQSETTVAVGGVSGVATPRGPAPAAAPQAAAPRTAARGELAATGSNNDATLKLAGGAVVAGAGLLVAAKLRRRPADA